MLSHDMVQLVAMISFIAAAVLLLGCVNISLIFFARLLERSRELALRTALGSSQARLLRQCLLESVLVMIVGLFIAIGLAALGIRWGQDMGDYPARILGTGRPDHLLAMHGGDIAAAAIMAIVLWLLSTLIPAWRISKQDAAAVLGAGGTGVATVGRARTAGVLVGLEVLISCLVLVICANMVLAVKTEVGKPSGLDPALTSQIMLSTYPTVFSARYADASERLRYWDDLSASIKGRIPGADVAYATAVPARPASIPVAIEHQEGGDNRGALTLPVTRVSDNYFEFLGLALRRGRLFESTDRETSAGVVVLDENVAKRYWPNEDPLGKRIQLNPKERGTWLTVVGVVAHVGAEPYSHDVGAVYQPLRQAVPSAFQLLVKVPPGAEDSHAALREAAFSIDPDLPLHNLQMLNEYLKALNSNYGALGTAFSTIAAITIILAASGLFGLISRSVARRTQEVGIRRALGSTQWRATSIFLRQGILYLSIGVIGIALGIVVTNLLSSEIDNILVRVIPTTLSVSAAMAFVILIASYLPARRAVALEPGDALRYE
jgi:predicted permease